MGDLEVFEVSEYRSVGALERRGVAIRAISEDPWPASFELKPNDIHVWAVCLDQSEDWVAKYRETLSSDEVERAERFRFDHDRARFITARGFLRVLLGKYLESDPAQLTFAYGQFGKPSLVSHASQPKLQFNLAHSEHLALLAITKGGLVGIDLERIRFLPDYLELVERFFSSRENAIFRGLTAQKQAAAFFNLWTRKEAWLKATGSGISQHLNRVEVSFVPGEPARLISLPDELQFENLWFLHDLELGKDFAAALATTIPSPNIRSWRVVGENAREMFL